MGDPLQAEADAPHATASEAPASSTITNFRTLPTWAASKTDAMDSATASSTASPTATTAPVRSPFIFDPRINAKVSLWTGEVSSLMIEAIVNSTNENLDERGPMSMKIFEQAGPELKVECRSLGAFKTGEVKITKGYKLPCRFVFHTVGPRFNSKYKTAAESALYNSYRESLQGLREHGLTSLALMPINSGKRGYPSELGAHIALRTVRRFLEKHGEGLERIVFGVDEYDDIKVYAKLMPLYFPRSLEEEAEMLSQLPADIGNEDGEPVIEERKIRIETDVIPRADDDDDSLAVQFQAANFGALEPDRDLSRKEMLSKETESELAAQRAYKRWLKKASTEDLTALAKLNMIYTSGTDHQGRRIVAFIGRNFPATTIDPHKLICYLISSMDTVVDKEYVIVYFHSQTTSDNRPELGLLRDFYSIVDHRYKKNLRRVYIVHPTFWSKAAMWFFTTFTVSDIKEKIHNVEFLHHLFRYMGREQLRVPQFALDFDAAINGTDYFQTESGVFD
eukprot:m.198779 g.198779  ORF g.198779 m.198779 type:complete len:508 (+) comp53794_c0_seq1:88-1611(+)